MAAVHEGTVLTKAEKAIVDAGVPTLREAFEEDMRHRRGRTKSQGGAITEETEAGYRERVMPFWDADARGENATSEIVAVSVDGISWREPTEREKQGWLSQIEDSLQYLNEHGEMPENAFKRQLEAARTAVKKARQAQMLGSEIKRFGERELELRLREAEAELERARNDY